MSKKKPTTPPPAPTQETPAEPRPRVHKELEGFNIQINSFGEISNSYDIDKINQFLNKTVDDKKLRHRADLKQLKGEVDPVEPEAKTDDDELTLDADLDDDDLKA
jgi:hypothetical protein